MITTKTITIGEQSITVGELTVGQIDAAVGQIEPGGPMHRHYNLMGYDLTPEFVASSSGLSPADQGGLDIDELDALVSAVAEVNGRFLSRIKGLAAEPAQEGAATSAA